MCKISSDVSDRALNIETKLNFLYQAIKERNLEELTCQN